MTTFGLPSKKRAKADDKQLTTSNDDASQLLKQLEKKKQASPDACIFC